MNRRLIFPRSLQYLIAIAEYGSFTRAADALYVSQPTLSQQIKQLEASLQTSLLDRSGRTVKLTDAGQVYVYHACRAWDEMDAGARAIDNVDDLSRGSLRLGWTPITDHLTCCLLENYNYMYPGITLSTLEMPQDDIKEAVIEGRIDIGIAFTKPFTSDTQPNEIETHVLFEEKLCLVVGNSHTRANMEKKVTVEELGQESLALLNTDFALRQQVDKYCLKHHITPHIAIETNSLNVIIEMVQFGQLATILPNSIVRSQCGLHAITPSPELPQKAVTLITRKEGYKSPACKAFSALASDWASRRLEEIPRRKMTPCPLSDAGAEDSNKQALRETSKSVSKAETINPDKVA
ncbi:MAG TPA: transcriptional regulator CynR [Gammaproteobacteria bacterium]|nr:transcriptional regulator CynR [Gammaproteobacteria bacterium]